MTQGHDEEQCLCQKLEFAKKQERKENKKVDTQVVFPKEKIQQNEKKVTS